MELLWYRTGNAQKFKVIYAAADNVMKSNDQWRLISMYCAPLTDEDATKDMLLRVSWTAGKFTQRSANLLEVLYIVEKA